MRSSIKRAARLSGFMSSVVGVFGGVGVIHMVLDLGLWRVLVVLCVTECSVWEWRIGVG